MNQLLFIQSLYLYPIKSLGGIAVQEASIEERGFKYDRRWMLVDRSGEFLTQRQHPQLALLQVTLTKSDLAVFSKINPFQQISFDLALTSGKEMKVKVWGDEVAALQVAPGVSAWFSGFLSMDVELVVMPESSHRKLDPRYAVNSESVSFADGMPYVMIGQASLDELNGRLSDPVGMDRFRPNLVFSGGEAFAEDQFKHLQIGEVEFQVVKPCARCVMITVDQEKGTKGKEPLATLATYRSTGNKVYFGQNLVSLTRGIVKVGDPIQKL
jgi:uncharacterized protein